MFLTEAMTTARQHIALRLERLSYRSHLPELPQSDQRILAALSEEGAYETTLDALGVPGSSELLDAAPRLIRDMEQLPKRTDRKSYIVAAPPELITNYPEIIRWGLDERLLAIAERYIGTPVTYRGVLARLDLPNGVVDETRLWHLDQEHDRILKIVVYLEAVDHEGGPFEYISAKVGVPRRFGKGVKLSVEDEEEFAAVVPRHNWRALMGPRGTVGFVDTCTVFHRGRLPARTRKSLFFCYNSKSPFQPSYCGPLFAVDRFIEVAGSLTPRQRASLDFSYLRR